MAAFRLTTLRNRRRIAFAFAYPVVTEADLNAARERYAQEENAVRWRNSVSKYR